MISDLLWNMFERCGMINIYLLYKQVNFSDQDQCSVEHKKTKSIKDK